MKQLRLASFTLLFTALSIVELSAQARAIITTDRESYVYGDTMEICRIAINEGPDTEEIYEDGCCSDRVIINGINYQQFYIQPYTYFGECIPDAYEECHLGFVTWPLASGESYVKDCMELRLINTEHCIPGIDWTTDFEVTNPLRIEVFIEGVGSSEEMVIPVDLNLPVELENFDAALLESGVALSWSTHSERNNAYFEIEMSDGEEYRMTTSVTGNGSTLERNEYSHKIQGLSSGTYSFRLSQTDFDGTRRVLSEVEIFVPLDGEYELSMAYPNPTTDQFNLDLKVKKAQHIEANLFDIFGRQVASLYNRQSQANESIQITSSSLDLANGSYVFRVRGEYFEKDGIVTIQK